MSLVSQNPGFPVGHTTICKLPKTPCRIFKEPAKTSIFGVVGCCLLQRLPGPTVLPTRSHPFGSCGFWREPNWKLLRACYSRGWGRPLAGGLFPRGRRSCGASGASSTFCQLRTETCFFWKIFGLSSKLWASSGFHSILAPSKDGHSWKEVSF